MTRQLVEATQFVYKSAQTTLLPTPSKSHYTFNLRDFARVINGVLMVPGRLCNDKPKMIRLWVHEIFRV